MARLSNIAQQVVLNETRHHLADATKLLRRWLEMNTATEGWSNLEPSQIRRLRKQYRQLVEDTEDALEALERRGY